MIIKSCLFIFYSTLLLINTSFSEKNILVECLSAVDSLPYSPTPINTAKSSHRYFKSLKKMPKDYSWLDTIDIGNPLIIHDVSSKNIKQHLHILKPFLKMHKGTYLDYKRCGFSMNNEKNIIDMEIYSEILPYTKLSIVLISYLLSHNQFSAAARIINDITQINTMLAKSRLGLANIVGNAGMQFAIDKILVNNLSEIPLIELMEIYKTASKNMWQETWIIDGILIDIRSRYGWQDKSEADIRNTLIMKKEEILSSADGIEAIRICSYIRIIRSYLLRGNNYPEVKLNELSKIDEILASKNSSNNSCDTAAQKELKRGMANLYWQSLHYLDILRYHRYTLNKIGYRISELKTGVFPGNWIIVENTLKIKLPLDLITGKRFKISNSGKCENGELSKGYVGGMAFCLSPN